MKARRYVLLVVALAVAAGSCGDGGPVLLKPSKDWLVQFKRVTLADDAPDRLEIEVMVRTGMHFSEPAADDTTVVFETTLGGFEGNGPRAQTSTFGGHAVVRLIPPSGPAQLTVTARVENTESRIEIQIDDRGSMRISS